MQVDTGANGLVLPMDVVDRLGLRRRYQVLAEYADGRTESLWVADGARVKVLGREAAVECIVGPPGSHPLLGRVPLEVLDLLVDCRARRLVVNPRSPDRPLFRL
jgi:clan AA aspartic protease